MICPIRRFAYLFLSLPYFPQYMTWRMIQNENRAIRGAPRLLGVLLRFGRQPTGHHPPPVFGEQGRLPVPCYFPALR